MKKSVEKWDEKSHSIWPHFYEEKFWPMDNIILSYLFKKKQNKNDKPKIIYNYDKAVNHKECRIAQKTIWNTMNTINYSFLIIKGRYIKLPNGGYGKVVRKSAIYRYFFKS